MLLPSDSRWSIVDMTIWAQAKSRMSPITHTLCLARVCYPSLAGTGLTMTNKTHPIGWDNGG